jgi:hypothetical protein
MKVGDLVQVSVKGRDRNAYPLLHRLPQDAIGVVTDVIGPDITTGWLRYRVEWSNGHWNSMRRDEIKYLRMKK